MKKLLKLVPILTLLLIALTGCAMNEQPQDKSQAADSLQKLEKSTTAILSKDLLSFNNSYKIDTDTIGGLTSHGEIVNFIGDQIKINDKDGNTLLSESQSKRFGIKFDRAGTFSDVNGNEDGFIETDYFKTMLSTTSYYIYDKDQKEIGYLKEKLFSWTKELFIIDSKTNEKVYSINKKMVSLNSKYTIKKLKDTDIPFSRALVLAQITDMIDSSKSEKDN